MLKVPTRNGYDIRRAIIKPGLQVSLDGVFCEEVMKSNQKLFVSLENVDFAEAETGQDDITYLTIKHNKRE